MLPFPTKSQMSKEEKALLDAFRQLADSDRHALQSFADYLLQRGLQTPADTPEAVPAESSEPAFEPRPEKESVVKAIQRLGRVYYMVNRSELLDETSALMSQHVMQGRSAKEVIDDLETLFENKYRELTS